MRKKSIYWEMVYMYYVGYYNSKVGNGYILNITTEPVY